MKTFGKIVVGGVVAIGALLAIDFALTICAGSSLYNAWEILEEGGFHEAADYLHSKVENEATRLWMDRSIAEYKKSLHQDET